MPTRSELDAAYRATTYRIFLPGGAVELRVDAPNPALAAWLAEEGVREWAILTAANPGSQPLPAADNAERQAQMECALLEQGYEPYAGENIADGGDWPAEESCFVPGIPVAIAMALARQFGQNAILLGTTKGVPLLAWTESTEE